MYPEDTRYTHTHTRDTKKIERKKNRSEKKKKSIMAKRLFGERLGKDLSQVLQLENSRTFFFFLNLNLPRRSDQTTHLQKFKRFVK